ncbi:MAG: YqgE/AlgH family protein [Deltaproteobacteria bacterium]|nr:YqgE/AlgH family protein [Deltaproteobacteria bacterium]
MDPADPKSHALFSPSNLLQDDKLAPGFLIAPPSSADPNFGETVVLLASHDDTGATGFIISRLAGFTLHTLLDDLEIKPTIDDRRILLGGPVSSLSGFVLYQHAPHDPGYPGFSVSDEVSISASKDLLESCAHNDVKRFDLIMGCAGWGPDQLEDELRRGMWLHASYDEEMLFDVDVSQRYDEIYARLGISPFGFMDVKGGAQA